MGTKFNPFGIFVSPKDCVKINQICADYLNGKINRDTCIEQLYQVLRKQINLFASKVHSYYKNLVDIPHEDIVSECLKKLVEAVDKLNPSGNYKHHVLTHVFHFTLSRIDVGWKIRQRERYNFEEISLQEVMKEDEETQEECEDLTALLAEDPTTDMYSAIEVRDFISKLSPLEQKFVRLLLDGYTQSEIGKILGLNQAETSIVFNRIREKAQRYFGFSGGSEVEDSGNSQAG